MYYVRVEADFSAAHYLRSYHGKCENLHGHNYRVRLWAGGERTGEGGMLADFGILKKILRGICASMDHGSLNDNPVFEDNPSAERIARHVFDEAALAFGAEGLDPALLHAVDVYETPGNMARYGRDAGDGPQDSPKTTAVKV
jgi:6-pyruvoyltetrahydropterin/6-carboxytetrahydropterin synthase